MVEISLSRMANKCFVILACFLLSCFFCVAISHASDTLKAGQVMRDGEILESSNQLFQLRFFDLRFSRNHYLGIYPINDYIIWVANRENPLVEPPGVLAMTQDGDLVISDNRGTSITINSEQPSKRSNTSATLLDSGNLVLREGDRILWQTFDYPSDAFLPGMKLGFFDLKTGRPRNQFLTSWESLLVPAPGTFTLGVDPNNKKQLVIRRSGVLYWRSGIWNGYNFSYLPVKLNFSYISNENESYFTFTVDNNSLFRWFEITIYGGIRILFPSGEFLWQVVCDDDKVETRYKQGCVTPEPSRCRGGDVFPEIRGIMSEWTDFNNSSLGLSDCKEICVRNCSCNAYASAQSDGTGCKISRGQKLDGQDSEKKESFYIRNNTVVGKDRPRKRRLSLIVGAPVVSLLILTTVSIFCYLRWRHRYFEGKIGSSQDGVSEDTEQLLELSRKKDHDQLPLFKFSSVEIATDHFSDVNKLGQGGFGPVYKGKLVKGQEIAVKRLSRSSEQGLEEFKNEVVLISKLQHRNLVRLMGCCIQGEERILIYEYLPNNSLDSFLFDATKGALLDWKKRLCIIEGIAQGLLYLHKYSRLRIIHRDLKTSNILLDSEMNPKISDFGTARIFGENATQANTNRIVGTYGYMSPEYAMHGLYSVKSDVFSFGVMMLEIISGKKNTSFYPSNRYLNLLGYVWDLYREGRCLELMDLAVVDETCSINEIMRCVQVGLLCVQESAVDRPTMSDVVSMLSNESITLPSPNQPAFSTIASVNKDANLLENPRPCSINDVTITEMEAR